jgi:hypothetical protein
MPLMRKPSFKARSHSEQFIALALIALGVAFRVLPHPDNFTPTTAIALFAGVVLPARLAFTVPLFIMMGSDLFLGLHPLFWLVWPLFVLVTWIGQRTAEREGVAPLLLASAGSSVLFFAVSNLGVFFFEKMYPLTWAGLVQCFTMALPFFRNSFVSDLLYTAALFALFGAACAPGRARAGVQR